MKPPYNPGRTFMDFMQDFGWHTLEQVESHSGVKLSPERRQAMMAEYMKSVHQGQLGEEVLDDLHESVHDWFAFHNQPTVPVPDELRPPSV